MQNLKRFPAISFLVLVASASPLAAEQLAGPDWDPPFEIKQTQRQSPALAVKGPQSDASSLDARNKVIIAQGESAVARSDAPPVAEGNDFWAQDALHVPKLPTRNLFPNPSFEQGLRYWRWWSGGATYTRSEVSR